jgi:yeast amino acid transporter
MGWNYVLQWAVVLPLELTVAGLTVEYWQVGVSVGVWITGKSARVHSSISWAN